MSSPAPRSDRRNRDGKTSRTRHIARPKESVRPSAPASSTASRGRKHGSGGAGGAEGDKMDRRDGRDPRVFGPTGRLLLDYPALAALFGKTGFSVQSFIEDNMAQLSKSGFEHARQELDKFMSHVSSQILESAINNNEIYVQLGEAVHSMEPNLQRLHSLLTSLRSLLAQLRHLGTGGADNLRSASLSMTISRDVTGPATSASSSGLAIKEGGEDEVEAPELAPVLPVWRAFTQHLELALTEKKLHKVHRMLSAAEGLLGDVVEQCGDGRVTSNKGGAAGVNGDKGGQGDAAMLPLRLWIEQKEFYLEAIRRSAISLLESSTMEIGIARVDLQQHVRLLSKLSTPLHSLHCLLAAHEQALDAFLTRTRAAATVDGDDFELLGAISQRVFGTIGCAANDMSLIFRRAARELSSAFTVWALRLTERCVRILLVDVLVQFAAPLGLPTTMECILQMLVYCSCLEDTHRVCLQPHMLRVLWPHLESVVGACVDSGCDRVRTSAMQDVTEMVATGQSTFPPDAPTPAAALAVKEAATIADELLCMDAIEVGKCMRQSVTILFRALCEGVQRGVQQAELQSKGALPAVLAQGAAQIMASLTHFMESGMPKALSPYSSKLGVLCVRGKLEPALHTVASSLGMQEATS